MQATYRDDLGAATLRRDELLGRMRDQLARVSHEVKAVHAKRIARSCFGLCASVGALAMGGFALLSLLQHGLNGRSGDGMLTKIVLWTWPAAFVAYAVGWALARADLAKRLERAIAPSSDTRADIERFEGESPGALAAEIAGGSEVRSAALPMIGISLLLPLTVHLVIGFAVSNGKMRLADYDRWICASVAFAGAAHLALAGMCWYFARKWHRLPGDTAGSGWFMDALVALGLCAAAGVVPTVIFAPVIILLTGAIPVPLMFYLVVSRLVAERRILVRESFA